MGRLKFNLEDVEVYIGGVRLGAFDEDSINVDLEPPPEIYPCAQCAAVAAGTWEPPRYLPWPPLHGGAYEYTCKDCGRKYESTPNCSWRQVVEFTVRQSAPKQVQE